MRGDGHPSRTAVAGSLVRSTRKHRAGSPRTLAQAVAVAGVRPLDLAPGGVYLAVAVACDAGGLLHHPFTLTLQPKLKGGLLSVALSRGSPRVGVTDHPAVWSPDLPHRAARPGATARPTHPERKDTGRARSRSHSASAGAESSAMPLSQVARGGREGRARAGARRPRAERGVIANDFAFRGRSAANKLSKFRGSRTGGSATGTTRTERARAGPARRREHPSQRHERLNRVELSALSSDKWRTKEQPWREARCQAKQPPVPDSSRPSRRGPWPRHGPEPAASGRSPTGYASAAGAWRRTPPFPRSCPR